jgi:hypothetical protein
VRHLARALAAAGALAACGGGEQSDRTVPATPGAATATATAAPTGSPTCLGSGHWEECTLPDRLERAGLVPIARDSITRPWLAVAGRSWQLHRSTLHVFRYPDADARARDQATLDTLRAAPAADTTITWNGRTMLLASDNLLAVLVSDDDVLRERVALAITAGPTPTAVVPGRP